MNGKEKVAPAVSFHDFFHDNGSRQPSNTEGPSMTRQEFAEECDINVLMSRYDGKDIGALLRASMEDRRYIDFTEIPDDLMGYLQLQKNAENAFMTLPAVVRKEFDNDPLMFVEFAADPDNLDQMRTWGLAPPAKPVEEARAAPPSSAASPAPSAPEAPGAALGGSPIAPTTHGST